MSDRPSITFAEEHIDPILDGEKYQTIRLFGEEDPLLVPTKAVDLVDTDGERFAIAVLMRVDVHSVSTAAGRRYLGHENYDNAASLAAELEHYYPDHNIGASSTVCVYWFSTVEDTT